MSDKLACPECGSLESKVREIRGRTGKGFDGMPHVYRQRVCANGHRYSTKEVLSTWLDDIRAENAEARRLQEAIRVATRAGDPPFQRVVRDDEY